VRIEDVAATAGVSMKTVSVLNNEPNVSKSTPRWVDAAVEKAAYRPLPRHGSSPAGVPTSLRSLPTIRPNYLMEIEMGVLDADNHYNLMLAPLIYDAADIVEKVESLIMLSQLDGVVDAALTDDTALLERLVDLGIPYSSISAKEQNRNVSVVVDEIGAVVALIAHLASLGHTRIAHIKGHAAHGASMWRPAGYREGLRRQACATTPAWCWKVSSHTNPATSAPTHA
jgi:LacI family transcriptional regulator